MENQETHTTIESPVTTFLKLHGFDTRHRKRVIERLSSVINETNCRSFTEKAAKCLYLMSMEPKFTFEDGTTRSYKVMAYRRAKRSFELFKNAFNLQGVHGFNSVCAGMGSMHFGMAPHNLRASVLEIYTLNR